MDEITLILQDTLEKGYFINIMDFPFPKNLVDEDGFFYGEICVTLAYDPILGEKEGAEYCQSNIDVALGTYASKKKRDVSLAHFKNPIGLNDSKNLLIKDLYRKNPDSHFNSERMLVSQYQKYKPIKKWHVNLNEMTEGNKRKYLD